MADGVPSMITPEEQFWKNLRTAVSTPCDSHESIDDALRTWLGLVAESRDVYLSTEDDVGHCSQMLLGSPVYLTHKEYVRVQIIYSLLQEDEAKPLNVIANFLLLDGRSDEATFKDMIDENCFQRLIELLRRQEDYDLRLHRLLLELMFEMSRIDQLRMEDLQRVDDSFIVYMFSVVEGLSDDVDDPYHYATIRVLLMLNEQYMVVSTMTTTTTATAAGENAASIPLTNRVVKVLGTHGSSFKTFGENIILLLNRETETSLQLLILKLLYLLFTTQATQDYFYTNDLRVLLDVMIRNLLDLPDESASLRHTYLRVLYPLLSHTQLSHSPHYKRDEILKVLNILSGEGNHHFAPADATTVRLVERVAKVSWLTESGESEGARRFLGISLSAAQAASSISVVDVAAVMEKPGVQTPSRHIDVEQELKNETLDSKPRRILPQIPAHRHGAPTGQHTQIPELRLNNELGVKEGPGNGVRKPPPKTPPPRRTTKTKSTLPLSKP